MGIKSPRREKLGAKLSRKAEPQLLSLLPGSGFGGFTYCCSRTVPCVNLPTGLRGLCLNTQGVNSFVQTEEETLQTLSVSASLWNRSNGIESSPAPRSIGSHRGPELQQLRQTGPTKINFTHKFCKLLLLLFARGTSGTGLYLSGLLWPFEIPLYFYNNHNNNTN